MGKYNSGITFWPLVVCRVPDKRGNRDNLEITFLFFCPKKIHCDPLLEPSQQDGSNKGSQHIFFLQLIKNLSQNYRYPC